MQRIPPLAILLALFTFWALQATAAPVKYRFDYDASNIGFTYKFNDDAVQGRFPEFSGDLIVDLKDIRKSIVNVQIDASKGKAGFVFATSALRGPKILDTDNFPYITFVSTEALLSDGKATVHGDITVRGQTRPITLDVRFFQLEGQPPEARRELQMVITGRINRFDFGANGYKDLVGPFLDIKIDTRIIRQ